MQNVMSGLPTYDDTMSLANQARFAMDNKLYVVFSVQPIYNAFQSNEQGHPVYDEEEYIKIFVPGDTKTTVECPVTDEFRMRFSKQYDNFKKNLSQAISGMPLEAWTQMSVGRVAELKAMGVHTVEQLAGLDDGPAQKLMGAHDLRRKAQAFLDASKGEAENNKLITELSKRDDEINLLKQQMQQILEAQKPKAKA